MKKRTVLVLALVFVFALVGCNAERNAVMEDFVGIVTSVNDDSTSYIVKVTDSGSGNLKVGDRVIVQMVGDNGAICSANDSVKVEFNGEVEELTAVSIADKLIPRVFSVEKLNLTEMDPE